MRKKKRDGTMDLSACSIVFDPQNRDTPWKERLAKAIMDFTSVCGIVEEFLGDVAMRDERLTFLFHILLNYTQRRINL